MLRWSWLLLPMLLLSGCRSEPLALRTFVLSLPSGADAPTDAPAPAAGAPTIALDRVRVNPVLNQNRILVRGGAGAREVRWLENGAARWVLLPGDMVFESLLRDLRECGQYGRVLLTGQRAADYVLRLEVAALEVRVEESGATRAVCELEATLVGNPAADAPNQESEILWTGRRSAGVPLGDRTTEAAVAGLDQAFALTVRGEGGLLAAVAEHTRRPQAPAPVTGE